MIDQKAKVAVGADNNIIGVVMRRSTGKVSWMEIVFVVSNQCAKFATSDMAHMFYKTPSLVGNVALQHTFHLTWVIVSACVEIAFDSWWWGHNHVLMTSHVEWEV